MNVENKLNLMPDFQKPSTYDVSKISAPIDKDRTQQMNKTVNDIANKQEIPTSETLLDHPYEKKYETPKEIYLACNINEIVIVYSEVEEKTYHFGNNPLLIVRKTIVIETSQGVYRFPETNLKYKFKDFNILYCCLY